MKNSALLVETPEGVTFSYELATPVVRGFAWAVDALVLGAVSYIVTQMATLLRVLGPDWAAGAGTVSFFVLSVVYGIFCEWRWRGQTIGKRLFGLRVLDSHGFRLRLSQVVLRNLLRFLDGLPLLYLVGAASSLLSRNLQRLGDLVANTVVVRERHWEEPDVERIAPAKYNSLLAWPHIAARLRSAVEPDAVAMALRAVGQRDRYAPAARVELFRMLADYFRSVAAFPSEAIEGMSDEEYVRSVLRVIYRAN